MISAGNSFSKSQNTTGVINDINLLVTMEIYKTIIYDHILYFSMDYHRSALIAVIHFLEFFNFTFWAVTITVMCHLFLISNNSGYLNMMLSSTLSM